jgi:hypothetical protein
MKAKHVRIYSANDRGFHTYGLRPIECIHGGTLVVREASSVCPSVWIFAEEGPGMQPRGSTGIQLKKKQAEELIRRLQKWIDEGAR